MVGCVRETKSEAHNNMQIKGGGRWGSKEGGRERERERESEREREKVGQREIETSIVFLS